MSVPSIKTVKHNRRGDTMQEQKIMMALSELLMQENFITAHEKLELSKLIKKGGSS